MLCLFSVSPNLGDGIAFDVVLLARALQALSDPICCLACLCVCVFVCVWHFMVNFNAKYLGNEAI